MTWISRSDVDHSCQATRDPPVCPLPLSKQLLLEVEEKQICRAFFGLGKRRRDPLFSLRKEVGPGWGDRVLLPICLKLETLLAGPRNQRSRFLGCKKCDTKITSITYESGKARACFLDDQLRKTERIVFIFCISCQKNSWSSTDEVLLTVSSTRCPNKHVLDANLIALLINYKMSSVAREKGLGAI